MVDEGWGRKVVDYCLPGLSCYPGFRPVESSDTAKLTLRASWKSRQRSVDLWIQMKARLDGVFICP
jgi:hypothetical protein